MKELCEKCGKNIAKVREFGYEVVTVTRLDYDPEDDPDDEGNTIHESDDTGDYFDELLCYACSRSGCGELANGYCEEPADFTDIAAEFEASQDANAA